MSHLLPHFEPHEAAKAALQKLYLPYKWLIFLPFLVVSTNLAALSIIIYGLLGGQRLMRIIPIIWARANAKVTPASVEVVGREHIDPNQSYVVVANHQSHFDIFAIYGWLGIDIRWVMKKELRHIPVFGYACEVMGHVIIDRSNHRAAMASIETAKSRISNGTSIIFFPEGTRSLDGQLLPFKAGAFKFAKDLSLPILPVTITGSHDILPSKTIRLQPGQMQMIVHPPIEVTEKSSIKALARKASEVIDSAL
ncbi:MAG: 1-acyl-sn-glycerol-3-phosphate acyltransferase [Pseudomonadales bacterium]|nr:1-acyl-sn-glycerol-3-phosphate acyltransferase [Pseudomonadales bacterium]